MPPTRAKVSFVAANGDEKDPHQKVITLASMDKDLFEIALRPYMDGTTLAVLCMFFCCTTVVFEPALSVGFLASPGLPTPTAFRARGIREGVGQLDFGDS